jgi:ketol-acid reductoisomerase
LTQPAYPEAARGPADAALVERFKAHPIHDVLRVLSGMRPAVDIAVT